jgi:hypothetical protein
MVEFMTSYSHSLPFNDDESHRQPREVANEAPRGGSEAVKWVIVEKTMGLLPAQIMAERLQADGIPARAWQEGAGRALGLTVGILGTGHVIVPAEYETEARAILDAAAREPLDWDENQDEQDEEDDN